MLINAMAQPALLYLGEIPHPGRDSRPWTSRGRGSRSTCSICSASRAGGNLTPQEESLLESVLYQLRMRYVARSGGAG
jgi:hypothetical protein